MCAKSDQAAEPTTNHPSPPLAAPPPVSLFYPPPHFPSRATRDDLQRFFHDVKFVCMGGSVGRMAEFAQTVADELGELESVAIPYGMRPSAIGKTDRYSMFKVGPVLISSHGMGQPSMSILLHEVAKLLDYAGADDPVFIRLGTSGGLGVKPGTVVVTNEGMNGMLGSDYTLPVNGKMISRPAKFHEATVRMQHGVVRVG